MITGRCEALGELVLARAATGASTRAITAAAAVMSFLFRDIPASRVKIGTVTDPNVDHEAETQSHRPIPSQTAGLLAARPAGGQQGLLGDDLIVWWTAGAAPEWVVLWAPPTVTGGSAHCVWAGQADRRAPVNWSVSAHARMFQVSPLTLLQPFGEDVGQFGPHSWLGGDEPLEVVAAEPEEAAVLGAPDGGRPGVAVAASPVAGGEFAEMLARAQDADRPVIDEDLVAAGQRDVEEPVRIPPADHLLTSGHRREV